MKALALAGALVAALATPLCAHSQQVKPPIALYWVSVETSGGLGMAMPPGMAGSLPAGMQGGKRMKLDLGSTQSASGAPRASHAPGIGDEREPPFADASGATDTRKTRTRGTRSSRTSERAHAHLLGLRADDPCGSAGDRRFRENGQSGSRECIPQPQRIEAEWTGAGPQPHVR